MALDLCKNFVSGLYLEYLCPPSEGVGDVTIKNVLLLFVGFG